MPTVSQWSRRPRRNPPSETGFETWLNYSLKSCFGDVALEPVPPELVELIRKNTQAN